MDTPDGWVQRLSLRHLQILVTLADRASISDTARVLASTQPAISKWLRELETQLGAPLFDRQPRGLQLTGHGQVLVSHARRILSEVRRAHQNLSSLHASGSWRVQLGSTPIAVTALVPSAIAHFLGAHPLARVELHEHTLALLLEKLDRGELDVVVGSLTDFEPRPGIRTEALYAEPLCVVARAGHPLTRPARRLDWDQLAAHDWVLWPEGTQNRRMLDNALTRAGRGPLNSGVESSSLLSTLGLVERSDLLAAVSAPLAQRFAEAGRLAVLPFKLGAESLVGLCWREEPLQIVSTLELLRSLRTCAAQAQTRPVPPLETA